MASLCGHLCLWTSSNHVRSTPYSAWILVSETIGPAAFNTGQGHHLPMPCHRCDTRDGRL